MHSYLEVYNMIRNIVSFLLIYGLEYLTNFVFFGQTGIGKGPSLVIHDGFQGLGTWKGFMIGADVCFTRLHPSVALFLHII